MLRYSHRMAPRISSPLTIAISTLTSANLFW